ncbi:Hypothetical protein I595_224 [Croceitalea dokdonensis DOKDO 023]|uniref:Uncharacterized protein n=1 Tax=Croceitalea dokdonensis DOKDO 023 TaxID=1300341 RepID=A0A0P7AI75_9FLAO|nr:hypothetical protein [Croceitalea dokdonensis]KPM33321.1 Hypothetical protein I595_224 [Croceitalea dokdonensis DOKDO 023]
MPVKTRFNKLAKKRIIIESFVAFLIILSPFVFKSHEYLPEDENIESIKILWFEMGQNGFGSIEGHGWFIMGKLVPLYLLVIWFFTCKHWWYHIILLPILMYAFQLFELFFTPAELNAITDSQNLMWLLPVCVVVIPFVYFIRLKLYDKHVHGIDLEAMDEELNIIKAKEELRREREKLEQLKKTLEKKM